MNRLILGTLLILGFPRLAAAQSCFLTPLSGPWQVCQGATVTYSVGSLASSAMVTGYSVTGGTIVAQQTGTGPVWVTINWTAGGNQVLDVLFDCPGNTGQSSSNMVFVVAVPVTNWIDRTIYGPDTVTAGDTVGYKHCYAGGLGPTTAFLPIGYSFSEGGQLTGFGSGQYPPTTQLCPLVDSFSAQWCSPGAQEILISMIIQPGGCIDTFHKAVYVLPGSFSPPSYAPSYAGCDSVQISAPPGYLSFLWSDSSSGPAFVATQWGTAWVQTLDSNSCVYRDSFLVDVGVAAPLNPQPGDTENLCRLDSVVLSVMPGYASYQWSNSATTFSTAVSGPGLYTIAATDSNGCNVSDSILVVQASPDPLAIATTSSLPGCVGDSVLLSGTPGFGSYLWSNGDTTATSLFPLTTSTGAVLTALDSNNCLAQDSVWLPVVVRPPLALLAPGGSQLCAGDSALLTASLGFSSYQWSTGDSLPITTTQDSGWASVVVTDSSGCLQTDSILLTVFPTPSVEVLPSFSPPVCPSDTVALTATPGFASYSWSQGGMGPVYPAGDSGVHIITATDSNGCVAQDTTQINWLAVVPPQITALGSTPICAGDTVTLTASCSYPTYAWSNGDTTMTTQVSSSGTYALTVVLPNGCSTTSIPLLITVLPNPTPQLSLLGDTLFCSASGTSYAWFSNGNLVASTTVNYYVAPVSGTYTAVVQDTNGCVGESGPFVVNLPIARDPQSPSDRFTLFSSPALDGHFNLEWTGAAESVVISDAFGRRILDRNDLRSQAQGKLPLRVTARGVYFVTLQMQAGGRSTQILLVP
ncbi:MAG: hypothetical protein AAF998_24635 [Bacteroidota bacterium]